MKKIFLFIFAISAIFQTTNTMIRLARRFNPVISHTSNVVRAIPIRSISNMDADKASRLFGLYDSEKILSDKELNERRALLQILYNKAAAGAKSDTYKKQAQEKVQEVEEAYDYLTNYNLNIQKLSGDIKKANNEGLDQIITDFLNYYKNTNSRIDLDCPELTTNSLFQKAVAAKIRQDKKEKWKDRVLVGSIASLGGFYVLAGVIAWGSIACKVIFG